MFSPFRSPALRARRSAHPPRSPRPPESLGEIEAAVAAAIPLASAAGRRAAKAQTGAEGDDAPEHAARFHGGGGGFV